MLLPGLPRLETAQMKDCEEKGEKWDTLPNALFRTISSCLPFIRGCRWHLASLILKEAFCLIGAVTVSKRKGGC